MRLIRVCKSCGYRGPAHDYHKSVTITVTCPRCKKHSFVARDLDYKGAR